MIRRMVPPTIAGLGLLLSSVSCAYLNTFYNAEQAYERGERLSAESGDTPSASSVAAYEKAAEKSARVLRQHPGSQYADDALLLMGRSFLRLGRHADAVASFGRLVSQFPDSDLVEEARLGLARGRRLLGDARGAKTVLAQLTGEQSPEVLHERALVDLELGYPEEAARRLEEIFDRHPDYARDHEIMLRLADARRASGREELAVEAYGRYRQQVTDPVARRRVGLWMAETMGKTGRVEEAARLYYTLLEESPSDSISASLRLARGLVYESVGRFERAVEDFREVKALWPGSEMASVAALHEGRIAWLEEARREAALEILLDAYLHAPGSTFADSARTMARGLSKVLHFRSLVQERGALDPDLEATATYRLAEEILAWEEDREAAVETYASLVDRFPESPWARRAMLANGILERRAGDLVEARRWFERLIADHPDSPEADSARAQLGRDVPEREPGFYGDTAVMVRLLAGLPRVEDPMIAAADDLDRYADARNRRVVARRQAARQESAADEPSPSASPPVEQGGRTGVPVGVQ